MEESTELEYLKWFHQMADFGPSDGDVRIHLQEMFERETGKRVPSNWKYE